MSVSEFSIAKVVCGRNIQVKEINQVRTLVQDRQDKFISDDWICFALLYHGMDATSAAEFLTDIIVIVTDRPTGNFAFAIDLHRMVPVAFLYGMSDFARDLQMMADNFSRQS